MSCEVQRGAGQEQGRGILDAATPCQQRQRWMERRAGGAAVAIALMSGAPANVWLVTLPFRSLPLPERGGDGETRTSFSEKKGASGAD